VLFFYLSAYILANWYTFCVEVSLFVIRFSVSIAAGFTGWMSYIVSVLLQHHTHLSVHADSTQFSTNQHRHHLTLLHIIFLVVAAAVALFLIGQTLRC